MTKQELKAKVRDELSRHAEEIIAVGDAIFAAPELGYKEEKTSAEVRAFFERMGISYEYPLALTGVKARLPCRGGPNVCILGEMDAVPCAAHPDADPQSGAAHACGHNAQIAAMLGAAIALRHCGAGEQLGGSLTFFAVPAEEFAELEYRGKLRAEGKIRCLSGKQELISRGAFDDVDIAMMVHAQADCPEPVAYLDGTSLGFVAKNVTFRGREAHAAEPFDGVNALNAAMLALAAINANRETFRDEDRIRVHPIITHGGDVVNSVPSEVRMETYVRGASLPAIRGAAEKVDRAIRAAADAVGARVEIETIPGYLPLSQDAGLSRLFERNAEEYLPGCALRRGRDMVGSTDLGDLSQLRPCLHVSMGGFTGAPHGRDFRVADRETAYLAPALLLAMTAVDLLWDDAAAARELLEHFSPRLEKTQYLSFLGV